MERCRHGGKQQDRNGSGVCVSKARVRRQTTKGEGQQPKEVRGPEMRDVVELCLQANVAQHTVALCVSSSEFVMGYCCKPIIK